MNRIIYKNPHSYNVWSTKYNNQGFRTRFILTQPHRLYGYSFIYEV